MSTSGMRSLLPGVGERSHAASEGAVSRMFDTGLIASLPRGRTAGVT